MQRLKFLLANLLIVVVVYANAAVILNYPLSFLAPRLGLPIPAQLFDQFILFGVFSFYETFNRDIEVYGITAPTTAMPEGEIVVLDTAEYFPFPRAEVHSRSFASRHGYVYGANAQNQALKALSAKIRERYNRSAPRKPIEKIVLVEVTWPRSLEGYESLKSNERLNVLFSE